jgi:oxygen-independent coproporphyrinogen III oxidase
MKSSADPPGLYIHVPFCSTKCPYCDFYSITSLSAVEAWLDAIDTEAALYRDSFDAFDSIYIGGGTPSLLDQRQLSSLMRSLHRHFSFRTDVEVTIEVNPDDVTSERLESFQGSGINRISLGVQSFDEGELRFLRRRHTAQQAEGALERIRSHGFSNVGIDLIYGFEGHGEDAWTSTLSRALAFAPEHLSCYLMTLEEGTPFGKMKAEGKMASLGEEAERSLFLLTSNFLEHRGYTHYEVSNFARGPEYTSRHNQKYWRHVPYLGLGPAAHSYQAGIRWWNVRSVDSYCTMLMGGELPIAERETLSADQLRLEKLYLGFRNSKGVALDLLLTHEGAEAILADLKKSSLIEIKADRVVSTREGLLVSDSLPLLFCN